MADLGAIGFDCPGARVGLTAPNWYQSVTFVGVNPTVRILPTRQQDRRYFFTAPKNGTLSGVVSQLGIPVKRLVRCYDRSSGLLVASTEANESGQFSFSYLNPDDKYFVIAFDDLGQTPDYNAVVSDLLTPVVS